MSHIPLAERVRPQKLPEMIGQAHLLGDGAPINMMIKNQHLPSLILYGEAGIGKTTMARLLAKAVGRKFKSLSAISAGVKELKEILHSHDGLFHEPPVLFIDEIHRFNKAQQDALLGAVESGDITLIGATTENPSFSINHALLSRCQVYRLERLSADEINQVLQRAITKDAELKAHPIRLADDGVIAKLADGDARKALNLLELAIQNTPDHAERVISADIIQNISQVNSPRYDKDGDMHYDIISAFIKSVRGSDADAALYWLARMLVAGEDPAFIGRRLVILASEDIGLANPNALILADTALRSVQSIGMPEARIILGQVTVYLAHSPKSNTSYQAINAALEFAKNDQSAVPLHLRNGVTPLMKQAGYGVDYIYPHDYPHHYAPQQYLPAHLAHLKFYEFGDNQKEQASFGFINWLKSTPQV